MQLLPLTGRRHCAAEWLLLAVSLPHCHWPPTAGGAGLRDQCGGVRALCWPCAARGRMRSSGPPCNRCRQTPQLPPRNVGTWLQCNANNVTPKRKNLSPEHAPKTKTKKKNEGKREKKRKGKSLRKKRTKNRSIRNTKWVCELAVLAIRTVMEGPITRIAEVSSTRVTTNAGGTFAAAVASPFVLYQARLSQDEDADRHR